MDVDVKSKAKTIPAAPKAPPPPPSEAAPSLSDRLLDPLQRKGGLAPQPASLPDLASGLQAPAPATSVTPTPSVAPSAADAKAATTAATPRLASGEKVVRNLWMVDGKLPWAAVEQFMGEKVPASIKESANKQLQGQTLDLPYVELIRQGDGLALQVEDKEHIVVGPVQLKADFYAPQAAKPTEAEPDQTSNDAGQSGRALVHDLGASLRDAQRTHAGLQAGAAELKAIRAEADVASGDGSPASKAARAGARNLLADGERRFSALSTMMSDLQSRYDTIQDQLGGPAADDGDHAALLQQAEELLDRLSEQINHANDALERMRADAFVVEGNDQQ